MWKIFKEQVVDYEFKVDVKKPPIPPPCKSIRCGGGETKYSKIKTASWTRYIKKYDGELKESRKKR